MARQQARRRNRERLTGIILACLGVVVLVVAAIALSAPDGNEKTATSRSASATPSTPQGSSASSSPASSSSRATSSSPGPSLSVGGSSADSSAAARKIPLVVLNNTTTNGLATDAARTFREGGWKVDEIDNLSNEIISTCAYYDPDVEGAEAAAKALRKQFPAIKRIAEKFPELPSGPIVVVLTPDYSAG